MELEFATRAGQVGLDERVVEEPRQATQDEVKVLRRQQHPPNDTGRTAANGYTHTFVFCVDQ